MEIVVECLVGRWIGMGVFVVEYGLLRVIEGLSVEKLLLR